MSSMAFAPTHSLLIPLSRNSCFQLKLSEVSHAKLPLGLPKHSHSTLTLSAASSSYNQPSSPFSSEEAVLEAVADLTDTETSLPAVRTYENDLARLTVVGAVDFQQALRAAAADGGEAADEHISSGMSAMVLETVFPGHHDDRSTVSTRLFLPSFKVKEKAIRLKRVLTEDVFRGTPSKNILAMTFRQVVLEQLSSFELALFSPGTERDMKDLENSREVPVLLALSSSDEHTMSKIGEAICAAALENMERYFLHDPANRASSKFLNLFKKRRHVSSKDSSVVHVSSEDSSVVLYNCIEHVILANAKVLLEKFKLNKGKYKLKGKQLKKSWLISPAFSKLEKIGGPEFCAWISECAPSYILEVDADKLGDVKFEGWKKSDGNRWEAILTHSQMTRKICPQNVETTNDIVSQLFGHALDLTKPGIQTLLSDLKPDLVFFDFMHWVPGLARELGIKSVHYCLVSVAAASFLFAEADGFPQSIKQSTHENRDLKFFETIKEKGSGVTLSERAHDHFPPRQRRVCPF